MSVDIHVLASQTTNFINDTAPQSNTAYSSDKVEAMFEQVEEDLAEAIESDSTKVLKTGDTMTGALILNGDPVASLAAATKQYVDALVAEVESNALTFTCYISATAPVINIKEGDLWYVGSENDALPWQVKTYTSGAWTTTATAYTLADLDIIVNLDEEDEDGTGTPGEGIDPEAFNPTQFTIQGGIVSLNPAYIRSNQSGQVKVRFTGLTTTGFTANTDNILSIRSATATVQSSPTTLWSENAVKTNTDTYETGFFILGADETADRLRENNVSGQCHRWRVAGNYSDKDAGNQGRIRCFLTNPDTGFKVSSSLLLPSGLTGDDFTFEFTSIADDDSLATGRGYTIGFNTTFDDTTLTVQINSIVRISEAIDQLR